jgi:hypothetical protein
MDEFSFLETTAEISVAFTGFIGIFLVLAEREGKFLALEVYAVRLVVLCSVSPVFFSAFPLILSSLGVSGPVLWRISSIFVAASLILGALYLVRRLKLLEHGEGRTLNYGFVFGLLAALSCLANLVGWPREPSSGLYLVTVWSIVGVAAGNFVELLFKRLL